MLTQLDTLKARLGITDVTDDSLLTNFIKSASARFANECRRAFARAEAGATEFSADETEIRVVVYPIEIVIGFDLKTDERRSWRPVQPEPDYVIRHDCVVSLLTPIGSHRQQGRVLTTGGYVLPGTAVLEGQRALPDDLEQACVEQCAYWYQNRNRLGLVSVSGEGAALQQFAQLDLLPNVRATLKNYERWAL